MANNPYNQYNQYNYYQQPAEPVPQRPAMQLDSSRSFWKIFFLSLLTFGIYGIIASGQMADDVDRIASRYDGQKQTNFYLMYFVLSWVTCGIYPLIWYHKFSARIGNELDRRGIQMDFGAGTFWLWNTVGVLILVGPIIYTVKLIKAVNALAADYNVRG